MLFPQRWYWSRIFRKTPFSPPCKSKPAAGRTCCIHPCFVSRTWRSSAASSAIRTCSPCWAWVADLADKEVFFLGSAGALKPRFREPAALQVGEIISSSIFKRFSRAASLPLKKFADRSFPVVRGVSVDVLQRETPAWLAGQRSLKTDVVEMELFPLRCFLGRPFHALVVLSDRMEEKGISPFRDKEKFNSEFNRAFNAITRYINHEESHPDPQV